MDYESTDPKELSVKKGDEVSVMDAIANVQVSDFVSIDTGHS